MAGFDLRAQVVDPLKAALPATKYKVDGYPGGVPARPGKRTVCVWTTDLKPLAAAPSQYEVDLTVLVLTPHQDPTKADDDLDAALSDVLTVLWTDAPGVRFVSATRTSFNDDTVQAWNVSVATNIRTTTEE
jgi:hypothetical protein